LKRVTLCALAALACHEDIAPLDLAGPPASIDQPNGSRAAGGVGESVSLSVRITDAEGRPTIAVPVNWSAQRGSVPAVDSTDDNGISNVTVTLPETPGVDAVTAEADGVGSTTFTVSTQPVGGSIVFRFLDAGGYHACGITTTEQLLCWGYSADGQLGLGSTDLKPFPTLIPGDNRYRLITGGFYHSCATTLASTVWCWGNSADGRLGNGALATEISSPVRAILSADTTVLGGEIVVLPGPQLIAQQVQAGELHTCAIDLAQHAWCWGGNPEGGVGIGESGPGNFRAFPVLVLTAELFKSVAIGGLHTCGITLGGGGRCWGYNVAGQLGDGGNASSPVPVTVGGFTFRTDGTVIFRSPDPDFPLPPGPFIAAGYDHSCGITTANQAVCWGLNQNGQLGDNNAPNENTPVVVAGGHTFVAVTAGLRHTCALDSTGAAWCWGANDLGQLGRAGAASRVPVAVEGGLRFAYIKAGELFTCGVTSDGGAWCWGDNEYGQLGDGSFTGSAVPVKVVFQP
jgi:alpha-tubulin suppressor-like RCC1 family protein